MTTVFVGHGAPNVVLLDDEYGQALRKTAEALPEPRAIVCVSAHWVTEGNRVEVTASERPDTIHDFGGFQEELYSLRYECPGDKRTAERVFHLLDEEGIHAGLNSFRGLDHGAWIPLMLMYPDADIPVIQVSMPARANPRFMYAMGKTLQPLRDEGVLLVGSGGIVHNLQELVWHEKSSEPLEWAKVHHDWIVSRVENSDIEDLFEYRKEAPFAARAHPTREHILPLFFSLGASSASDRHERIYDGFHYRALSMYSFKSTPSAA